MVKMNLVEIRSGVDSLEKGVIDAATSVILSIIKQVHKNIVLDAPVDTGLMRNNTQWSLNGVEYGGLNTFSITSASRIYAHKKNARPLGSKADLENFANTVMHPINTDPKKVFGYVSENVSRGEPYGVYQEFGTATVNAQPYFMPNVVRYGGSEVVTPKMIGALTSVKVKKMEKMNV